MAKKESVALESIENSLLQTANLSPAVLTQIYTNAYIDAAADEQGEVSLTIDGIIINVRILQSEPLILLYAFWPLNPHVPMKDCLKLCNDINDHMSLVRCSVVEAQGDKPPFLWVDYVLVTKGGITSREIVGATRTFANAIGDGLARFGTSGMFAQD